MDYDTFLEKAGGSGGGGGVDDNNEYIAPQIQPALSLPISSNIETLGKKFTSLHNLTKSLLNREGDLKIEEKQDAGKDNDLSAKYANLSISMLKLKDEKIGDTSIDNNSTVPSNYNSLSYRLSRVLNNPLSDSAIREYFTILDENYGDDYQKLIEPGIFGSMSRKKLRSKVEAEVIKNQSQILKEFLPVVKQLKQIQDRVKNLNILTQETNSYVSKNFQLSNDLNYQIHDLNNQKNIVNLKKNLLVAFKSKFTLNEYEEFVLTSGEINQEFFDTLKKAEAINENCSILLSIDNPQLGMKIMNKITAITDKAIERIVNYTNKTLDNLYSLSSKYRLVTLHQCLRFLKGKLNYFNAVISNFTDSRSKTLIDEFMNQIQGSIPENASSLRKGSVSSASTSRPIFILAHDPVRYIGDLLAYVHSTVVNESETISSIFTIEALDEEEAKEFKVIVDDINNKILKSLSKPIKSKIDQLIFSETKLSTIYSIYELVELYTMMLSKQLNRDSEIMITIRQLVESSQEKIFSILKNRLAAISDSEQAINELNFDLQPPEWIVEFYSDVLPIIDQSTTDTVLNFSQEQNAKFLEFIIDEPMHIITEHIKESKLLEDTEDQLIIRVNSLDLILSKIMPYSLLSDKVLEINQFITELTNQLARSQLDGLLKGCNLYDLYNVTNMIFTMTDDFFDVSIYEPIKENKFFTIDNINNANITLQEFLPNALIEIQQKLLKLNSPIIANQVTTDSSLEFVKFYNKFNQIVIEYLDIGFTWSDFEVATLLGIDATYEENLKSSAI